MTKSILPPDLDMTPLSERVEEARRADESRAHMTEEERQLSWGLRLERTADETLSQFKPYQRLSDEEKEVKRLAQIQKSEGMAYQGRFWEAAELCPDKDLTAEYRSIAKAIQLDDESKCKCPDTVSEIYEEGGKRKVRIAEDGKAEKGGKLQSVTPRFERKKVYSPPHGGLISLVECGKCGHRNVRPLTSRLNGVDEIAKASVKAKRPLKSDLDIFKV